MKLTKFEHACLVLAKGDEQIVIDPGGYTLPLSDLHDVVAIVITHEHADHWTADQLERILHNNPDARLFGPAGVVAAANGFAIEPVTPGDTVTVGGFELAFFGGKHAEIHSSIPIIDNVGVLVDGSFYYGGDSYAVPDATVSVLAAPVGAPWLKIGEAMDYVTAIAPRRAFPVHDATLSQIGRGLGNARLKDATERAGGEFSVLEPGESLEL